MVVWLSRGDVIIDFLDVLRLTQTLTQKSFRVLLCPLFLFLCSLYISGTVGVDVICILCRLENRFNCILVCDFRIFFIDLKIMYCIVQVEIGLLMFSAVFCSFWCLIRSLGTSLYCILSFTFH